MSSVDAFLSLGHTKYWLADVLGHPLWRSHLGNTLICLPTLRANDVCKRDQQACSHQPCEYLDRACCRPIMKSSICRAQEDQTNTTDCRKMRFLSGTYDFGERFILILNEVIDSTVT